MAKNATRFKMAVQTNLNRGGKNIRKTFLTKMYLILRDLSVPRIENFMRFKFRVNKIEKEREKTIRLTDSVECLTRFPLRSYPSLAFTRNKNPSRLLTISRFPPRNLSSLLHPAKNNDLFFTNVSRKSRHSLETAAKFHGQFNRAAPQNRAASSV